MPICPLRVHEMHTLKVTFYQTMLYYIYCQWIKIPDLCFCQQMVTVNALQAIYKLLLASPDTATLSKQLNAQLINVRRHFTD